MKRVVITGLGLASCLGNDRASVSTSLREGRSGIRINPEQIEHGFRSHVAGRPEVDFEARIDRKLRRFMADTAAYAYVAMQDAIADAGLSADAISDPRIGVIAGSGGGSCASTVEAADLLREKGVRRVGPYMVTRTMCSTVSANLATAFGIRGLNYSLSSACATSAHCIGAAMEQIQLGKQDLVFAGGSEELHWTQTMMFDAMGALSTKYNDTPEQASRPYDADRDGFVIAAWSWSNRWNTRRRAVRASWPRSSATAPPPTAPTWSRLPAKARRAACARHWPRSTAPSTTSTRTALRRRSATSPSSAR